MKTTQVERTEAVLTEGRRKASEMSGLQYVESHARDLARKMDAVKASIADYNKDCDCWKSDGPCASCYASSSLLRQFKNIVEDTAS